RIGNSNERSINGFVDEFRIYNYALTTQEIQQIYNTPPTVANVEISPQYPGISNDLSINYTFTDSDGDSESGTEIKWYRNGSEIVGQTTLTLPSSETSEGDAIYATIRPSDGIEFGDLVQSSLITVNDQLLVYYPFNGDVTDQSGNGFDGTPISVSPTTDRDGNSDAAYSFDGTNSYVVIPYPTINSRSFTFSTWFKTANMSPSESVQELFGGRDNGTNSIMHTAVEWLDGDSIYAQIEGLGSNDRSTVHANILVHDDQWHLYTITSDNTNFSLYLDGQLVDASDHQAVGNMMELAVLGGYFDDTQQVIYHFDGAMDDVRLYNYALTSQGVQSLYNTQPVASDVSISPTSPQPTDDLVLSYTFTDPDGDSESGSEIKWYRNGSEIVSQNSLTLPSSETSDGDEVYATIRPSDGIEFGDLVISPTVTVTTGSTDLIAYYPFNDNANDESGNGLDGTQSNLVSIPDRFGTVNTAYEFNGSNGYVEIPTQTGFNDLHNGSDFTISIWIQRDDLTSTQQRILCNTRGGDVNGINFHLDVRDIRFYIGVNSASNYPVFDLTWTDGYPNTNDWVHIAFTYEYNLASDHMKCYVNGQLIGSGNRVNPHGTGNADQNMNFGRYYSPALHYFDGNIDDIKFFNYTLTIQEIQSLYNTPPVAGNVMITPDFPGVDVDIELTYDYSDAEGHAESGSEIKWYRNGTEITGQTSAILPSSETSEGDQIYATIRPSDGIYFGDLVQSQTVTVSNQLVAYYPFNGNANDESGNGNNGQVFGDIVDASDRFGATNSAYSFDGNGDYMLIDKSDLPTPYSVSLWYNKQGNQAAQYLLAGE
ncbi:MAG: LamG domain-containing protein, partial [Gammaproteobacteria bacterium]|nr:LamG domain-containing protein [Gammaproteobacteria bacterium]